MHVFYLHGFASSPASSKACFFKERFGELGVPVTTPDFNQPDFSTLTVSRMLRQLEEQIAGCPAGELVLIGSSLGGFVAVEAAARQANQEGHRIVQLVLLAPAVDLEWERWSERGAGGPGNIDAWRRDGTAGVFHYADDAERLLNFSFYEDAAGYCPAARRLQLPMLIFQGRYDETVDPALVSRFAARQPDATLHLLDDGHQLKESLPAIWQETARALHPWMAGIHPS